jgi:hypothetical protein
MSLFSNCTKKNFQRFLFLFSGLRRSPKFSEWKEMLPDQRDTALPRLQPEQTKVGQDEDQLHNQQQQQQ